MAEHAGGRLQTCGHEHGGPDDGVEARDVFADELHGRPAALELLVVVAPADRADVVQQRVEPDVGDVGVVPRNAHAPVEALTRDREVVEAALHERHDLVAQTVGLNEVGLRLVEVEQALLKLAHAEEVVLLLEHLDRATVNRADLLAVELARSGHEVVGLLVLFATDAVVALVLAVVDVPVVVELLQKALHDLLVPRLGRADEVVVRDVDRLQQRNPCRVDELVGPLLRRDTVRDGRAQNLLPVLVGAGERPGVDARLPVPAREHVSGNLGVGVPDVRYVIDVEDRCRDVERVASGHNQPVYGRTSLCFALPLTLVRILRVFAGGLVGAAVAVALSGCVGTPAVQVYGDLTDLCFATTTTADTSTEGYSAYVGVTVVNTSPREIILREAHPLELVNAIVTDISIVPTPSPFTSFGFAPGGVLSVEQRPLYNDRVPIDGVRISGGGSAELVVELRARDFTDYAGIEGMRVKYDDGWFSATSVANTTVGFVPPWSHCGRSGP